MEAITLAQLLEAVHGTLLGDFRDENVIVQRVDTDSRTIHSGSLFIPLVGERFDGHAYINAALEGGALGCLTARERESYRPDRFYIKVASTQRALRDLAAWYKARFPIPFIAVTGSVGKTTTKDMVAAVLGQKYQVLKTEGNFNNELGLPLTLFRLNRQHEICVLEMGMNHFGEISYLVHLAPPDVAVITNIGDAHIENLGSRQGILKAKSEIFETMDPTGLAVLNGDDPLLRPLAGELPTQTVLCGADHQPPYEALEIHSQGAKGLQLTVKTPHATFPVTVPAPGEHMIYPVLMACAIGERFGLTPEQMQAGVASFVPTKMRMNVLHQGDLTILDDGYNANPQSMKAALEILSQTEGTYRAAVLGDMFELGELGPELHRSMGEWAASLGNIDGLLAVGDLAWNIYDAARENGMEGVFYAKDRATAKALLPNFIRPGGVILVKASRGMAFEEITREIQRLGPKD